MVQFTENIILLFSQMSQVTVVSEIHVYQQLNNIKHKPQNKMYIRNTLYKYGEIPLGSKMGPINAIATGM